MENPKTSRKSSRKSDSTHTSLQESQIRHTHTNTHTRFGCVIMRVVHPFPSTGAISTLRILGLRSVTSCARAAPDVHLSEAWRKNRINILLHLNVAPVEFNTFREAPNRAFALAHDTERSVQTPTRGLIIGSVTMPNSAILRDRQARNAVALRPTNPKRGSKLGSSNKLSPRVRRTISTSSSSSRGAMGQRINENENVPLAAHRAVPSGDESASSRGRPPSRTGDK